MHGNEQDGSSLKALVVEAEKRGHLSARHFAFGIETAGLVSARLSIPPLLER